MSGKSDGGHTVRLLSFYALVHCSSIFLPSYVDDVVEGYFSGGFFYADEAHADLLSGERGKIYIDLPSNVSYRYSGSVYVPITSSDLVEISNQTVQGIWDAAGGESA